MKTTTFTNRRKSALPATISALLSISTTLYHILFKIKVTLFTLSETFFTKTFWTFILTFKAFTAFISFPPFLAFLSFSAFTFPMASIMAKPLILFSLEFNMHIPTPFLISWVPVLSTSVPIRSHIRTITSTPRRFASLWVTLATLFTAILLFYHILFMVLIAFLTISNTRVVKTVRKAVICLRPDTFPISVIPATIFQFPM